MVSSDMYCYCFFISEIKKKEARVDACQKTFLGERRRYDHAGCCLYENIFLLIIIKEKKMTREREMINDLI